MTIEIAILNTYAVALAADTATTIIDRNGTPGMTHIISKLFTLTKHVGIMFYGLRDFYSIPWEAFIKLYREDLEERQTLKEYAEGFVAFLESHLDKFTPESQSKRFFHSIYTFFADFAKELVHRVGINKTKDNSAGIETTANAMIDKLDLASNWETNCCSTVEMLPELKVFYDAEIEKIIDETFKDVNLTPTTRDLLKEVAIKDFFASEDSLLCSGIVFAGFGIDDLFPGICELLIKGVINDRLVYKIRFESKISRHNEAIIRHYGIKEPVLSFLSGVTPGYQDLAVQSLEKFGDFSKALENLIQRLKEMPSIENSTASLLQRIAGAYKELSKWYLLEHDRKRGKEVNYHWRQILTNTAALPEQELATFAETLLNLTFFKAKYSRSPIDVVTITKGDGFEWVVRRGERHLKNLKE